MTLNRIDTVLSQTIQDEVMALLADIHKKMPFLLTLTDEDHGTLLKMGDASKPFVDKALDIATRRPDAMPANFDLTSFASDVNLVTALLPIFRETRDLLRSIDDTIMEAGSEAFAVGLDVYGYAKIANKDGALTEDLKDMAKRFSNRGRKKATPDSPPTE